MKSLRWATFRCYVYLLVWGLWHGERELRAEGDEPSGTVLLFTGTGSMFQRTVSVRRIFWNPRNITREDIAARFNNAAFIDQR